MAAKLEDWNDLRVFLALARRGTLARAAAELDVDPSTVFRRVGVLEERLGTRLLEKRGRRSVLTPAGEALAASAGRMEDEVVVIERDVAGRDLELEGTVRITTTDTVALRLLGPLLAGFHDAYPRISIDLVTDNRLFRLGRGEADIALRAGGRPTEPDVIARQVGRVSGAFYASAAYLETAGRPRRRTDLTRHRLVTVDPSLAHVPFARLTETVAPGATVACRCTSLMTQAMAVEAGLGVAALPCFLLDGRSGTVRLFPPEPELESGLWLAIHRDLRRSARVRAVVERLEAGLRTARRSLEGRS